MAGWSGGVFTRLHNWINDYNGAIGIDPTRHDAEDDNLAAGINACINKDGSNAFTGNIDAGSNKITNVTAGSAATDAATIGGTETLTGVKTFNENIVMQAANGVDFSANTGTAGETSSVLDWYEEGAWTPELWDSALATDATPPTYIRQVGSYTRIGRMVSIIGNIQISALNGISGSNIHIGAIPYTSANGTFVIATLSIGFWIVDSLTAGHGLVSTNDSATDYFTIQIDDNSGQPTNLTATEAGDSFAIQFSGFYYV